MGRRESLLSRLPHFYRAAGSESLLFQLLTVLGESLDAVEADILRVMRSHWVDTADNEGSEGLGSARLGDLDRLFALYLEALGGTSRLRQSDRREGPDGLVDDALYRRRMAGLIRILGEGASTREGIRAVVAANLGIVGEGDPAVEAARALIRLEEFLPLPLTVGPTPITPAVPFVVDNPNVVPSQPTVRLRLSDASVVPLVNPALRSLTTGAVCAIPGALLPGDELLLLHDGTGLRNGVAVPLSAPPPELPPGPSEWVLEAAIGLVEGVFDASAFDAALYEATGDFESALFDEAAFDESVFATQEGIVAFSVTVTALTPAAFLLRIPWDIPGFTDSFSELDDHPRNRIKYIVNRVKAAGVMAVVAYDKTFTESHELSAALTVERGFAEEHALEERNFDIGSVAFPETGGIDHQLGDALHTSGVFDFTGFDSLNTFA